MRKNIAFVVAFLLLLSNTFLHKAYSQQAHTCPQIGFLPVLLCDSGSVDVARLARDYSTQATFLALYTSMPSQGVQPFYQGGMQNGQAMPGQGSYISVSASQTFWAIAHNNTASPPCSDTTSFQVIVRPSPQLSLSAPVEVCPGDTVKAPTYTASQNSGVLFWEKLGGNPSLPSYGFGKLPDYVANANLGSVIRYDTFHIFAWGNGCLSDSQLWIPAIKPAPALDIGVSDTVCSEEGIEVALATQSTAGQTHFYLNNPSSQTNLSANILKDTVENFQNGIIQKAYRITPLTDGCAGPEGVVSAYIKPAPAAVQVGVDTVCSGEAWEFKPVVYSGQSPWKFDWEMIPPAPELAFRGSTGVSPQLIDTLSNTASTNRNVLYQVVPIGSNGCLGPADTSVVVVKPLSSAVRTDTLYACADVSGVAQFDLSSYSELYTDPTLLHPVAGGVAYTSVSDTLFAKGPTSFDCPDIINVILRATAIPQAPPISAFYRVCDNAVLEIDPGPGSFNFYNTSGSSIGSSSGIFRISAVNSPANIAVTREVRGCESEPVTTSVTKLPSPQITSSSNAPICESETLELFADGAFLYLWTGPQSFISTFEDPLLSGATVDLGGAYRVVGVNVFGCRDTSFEQVAIHPLPNPGRDSVIDICALDPAIDLFDVLGGSPDIGGVWSGPSALSGGFRGSLDPMTDASGIYTYSVFRTNPCQVSQTAHIEVRIRQQLQAAIQGDTIAPLGGNIRLRGDGGTSFAWSGPGGFQSSLKAPAISFLDSTDSGTFRLIVSTSGGCVDTAYHTVQARDTTTLFVNASAFLQGAYDPTTPGLMQDFLRQRGALTSIEPFSSRSWFMTAGFNKQIRAPFMAQAGSDAPVDWVLVELRPAYRPDSILRAVPGIVRRDGKIVDVDGTSLLRFDATVAGDYRVVIRHRNHLAIISQFAQRLSWQEPAIVDFRDPLFPTLGAPHSRWIQGGNAYLFSGDANADGEIQLVDDLFEWNLQVGQGGYLNADYNLDGQVQNSDRLYLWTPNVGRGTFVP